MLFHHEATKSSAAVCSVRTNPEGVTTIALGGELDHLGVAAVENEVRWAVANSTGAVALDCADFGVADSAGLRLLLEAEMMAVDHHLGFAIVNPSLSMQRLFRLSGLDDMLAVDLP